MFVMIETHDERIERLRKSVTWAEQQGCYLDVTRWRTTYLAALRELRIIR